MKDINLSDLGVGASEKYEAAFAAIHSGEILKADETELADHARALASYHVAHAGQDQVAAVMLIHNLQFKCITKRLSAQAERQTSVVIRLTRWLFGLTLALLFLTAYLCYDSYAKANTPAKQQQDSTKPSEPHP